MTCDKSYIITFYHWCVAKNVINVSKEDAERSGCSYLFSSINDTVFFGMEDGNNKVKSSVSENLVFALNKAAELTKFKIYFDLDKTLAFTLYTKISKDDQTKKNSTVFVGQNPRRDGTTSLLFENLIENTLGMIECKT